MQTLHRLLEKAKHTQFGEHYRFRDILDSPNWVAQYRGRIPVHNYNKMHAEWWHKCLEGEPNVSWPEKIKYFALSSGTSESASKHIPVTRAMLKTVKRWA
ncbi:GH3 auxin-responsive promoter family protein [Chitinophaga sedimenti]|uniref:GH3 family domain-containing protein n=1 Tax=Chitinophaga sedimenti TaxID=2033606 RepID=UPI002002BA7B|nr:GH3 auxin-responsive promoter family protein [Chitinophaga sedimenti]MCK7558187.1 GH3 auxin-responsive promoter family protein [Chitinophaga sedimenti]